MTYNGVVIQIWEEKQPGLILEDSIEDHYEEDVTYSMGVSRVWSDLSRQAVEQGYSSTLSYFSHRVADNSSIILRRNAALLTLALTNPVNFTRKVSNRTSEILVKASSIANRAAFILKRSTQLS